MLLTLAATEFEMSPFLKGRKANGNILSLVTGVGPVETAVRLMHFLNRDHKDICAVILFGIGGLYSTISDEESGSILDICLAETEVFGDVGITHGDKVDDLPKELTGELTFTLDKALLSHAGQILHAHDIIPRSGAFVTVSGVSGNKRRGDFFVKKYNGICENMEGAAVARVCKEFNLPFLEIRSISNLVEDRDVTRWRVGDAVQQAAMATNLVVKEFEKLL